MVAPKAVETQLASTLPANVGTLHFGQLRGQDRFKGVAALLVVSRPLPHHTVTEDDAEVIFGRDVSRLPASARFYDRVPCVRELAGGTTRTGLPAERWAHPDPDVEAVRWAACEAELIQAIGRGRGVHRTAADPLGVFVLTDIPLPGVPVSEVVSRDDLLCQLAGATTTMLRTGVLPLDWPGREDMMVRLGLLAAQGRKRPGRAAREWFLRDAADQTLLAAAGGTLLGKSRMSRVSQRVYYLLGSTAHSRLFGPEPVPGVSGASGPRWGLFTYRRAGQRKAAQVLVNPVHSDPRAAVEAALGPLSLFAPVAAPAPRKRPQGQPARMKPVPPAATLSPAAAPVPQAACAAPVASPSTTAHAGSQAPTGASATNLMPVLLNTIHKRLRAAAIAPSLLSPVPLPASSLSGSAATGGSTNAGSAAPDNDAVPLGLPALMNALEASGAISRPARRLHMASFQVDRHGTPTERERRVLVRLASELGHDAVMRASRAASAEIIARRGARSGLPAAPSRKEAAAA